MATARSLRRPRLCQLDRVRLEDLGLLTLVVRLSERGYSLGGRAIALGSVGKWRLSQAIAAVDGNCLMLLL